METISGVPLSGRRAQALRNDRLVFDAARAVFTADPTAPMAAVAERAGVGMSVFYRRYRSKGELLQRLALDNLERYIAAAADALADKGDPWVVFMTFMRRAVAEGAGSLSVRLAGSFTATDALYRLGHEAYEVTQQFLDHVQSAGVVRPDIDGSDISLLLEQLQAIRSGDEQRSGQLRQRYLALVLDALHTLSGSPLPGPPPTREELSRRYST